MLTVMIRFTVACYTVPAGLEIYILNLLAQWVETSVILLAKNKWKEDEFEVEI